MEKESSQELTKYKTRNWFFKFWIKILAHFIKAKEKTKVYYFQNGKRERTMNMEENRRIIREYFIHLDQHIWKSKEMFDFLPNMCYQNGWVVSLKKMPDWWFYGSLSNCQRKDNLHVIGTNPDHHRKIWKASWFVSSF